MASTWLVATGLLDTAGGWGGLAGGLGSDVLTGDLATGGFTWTQSETRQSERVR